MTSQHLSFSQGPVFVNKYRSINHPPLSISLLLHHSLSLCCLYLHRLMGGATALLLFELPWRAAAAAAIRFLIRPLFQRPCIFFCIFFCVPSLRRIFEKVALERRIFENTGPRVSIRERHEASSTRAKRPRPPFFGASFRQEVLS